MGRILDTTGIQELLYEHVEHPHWEQVASRCLACGNCTLVCPTCLCTTVEEETALDGNVAQRRRKWDSCFSLEFSYIHKGPVRSSAGARYRHWIPVATTIGHSTGNDRGCGGRRLARPRGDGGASHIPSAIRSPARRRHDVRP
jgi:ferredoxin